MSMCFVRECCTGFLAILMALVLSHFIGTVEREIPKSLSCCFNHRIWEQHEAAATYSASAVEVATEFCFFEAHEIRQGPRNWAVPEVLFLSTRWRARSASVYPTRSKTQFLGYHKQR